MASIDRSVVYSDFVGKRFGTLTVESLHEEHTQRWQSRWVCKCDCGKYKIASMANLTAGYVKQCEPGAHLKRQRAQSAKPRDMTGFRIGKLTVLGMVEDSHPPMCLCKCDCGNTVSIDARRIRSKKYGVKSCGCGVRDLRKSLIGKRFGHLLVIERAENMLYSGQSFVAYKCLCDCGKETIKLANNLSRGLVKSCGCLHSDAEERMESYLRSENINYLREYKFGDCRDKCMLPFDFAILDNDNNIVALIELDGLQHFENRHGFSSFEYTKKHDQIKDTYCAENDIQLIRIPYTDFNRMESIVKEFLDNVFKPFVEN